MPTAEFIEYLDASTAAAAAAVAAQQQELDRNAIVSPGGTVAAGAGPAPGVKAEKLEEGTDEQCSPRHQTHFQPYFVSLNAIL